MGADKDEDEDEDDDSYVSIESSDIEFMALKDKDDDHDDGLLCKDIFSSADPNLAALLAEADNDGGDDGGDTERSDVGNLKVSMSASEIKDLLQADGGNQGLEADSWKLLNAKNARAQIG